MPAPYFHMIHGDWAGLEKILQDLSGILNVDTTFSDILTPPGSDGEVIYNKDGVYGADSTFSFDDVTKVLTAKVLKITTVAASVVDTDKFLVDDSDEIKFRTGAELLSDIGGSAVGHLHDTQTLQHDAVNSDGGAFAFTTTGLVTFNQSIASANYGASNKLTACATNAGALDFSAASKTLTVEDNAIVSQDYTSDASPTFAGLTITNCAVLGSDSAVFQPNADSTTFLQILDAGGTPFLNVDTTNGRLHLKGGDSDYELSLGDNGKSKSVNLGDMLRIDTLNNLLYMNSVSFFMANRSWFVNWGNPTIYSTSNLGSNPYPFSQNGNLVFAPRANVTRDIILATGPGTPSIRMVVRGEGDFGFGGEVTPETFFEITTAEPYITFHNDTHEDSDGGRESRLNFKGEQSGGEETTLARIEVSHDGVADDQLGKIVDSVNTGAGLAEVLRRDSTLAITTVKNKITPIGGFAVKMTNKTGGNTVAGQLVRASFPLGADTDDAFETADADSQEVIGITLDAGIADGSEAWVVVSGIADVLMDGGGSIRGDRIISSNTAGSADVWNVGGAVATHFQEIGHCIETRAGAGLARCILHFN